MAAVTGAGLPRGIEYDPDAIEAAAVARLPAEVVDIVAGGAGDETAVRDNPRAWARYRLRPRVLQGVVAPALGVDLLGRKLAAPLLVSPMARQRMVHPDGEAATAAAAAATGIGYVLSMATSVPMAQIGPSAGPAPWYQLYVLGDRRATADLVHRAEDARFAALCVTVDTPVVGLRPRERRHDGRERAKVPRVDVDHVGSHNGHLVETDGVPLTWDDLVWLREVTDLPVVVKGVLTADDATAALGAGVDAVFVSNHGGRQLARVPATADVLAEVVAAVGGRVPVIVDGGVRTAADLVTALALGADVVGIGRPILWALAAGGPALLERFLDGLLDDLRRTVVLLGRNDVADLGPDVLWSPAGR